MRKLWVIARGEYTKIARKRSFVLGTLAIPVFFIAIMVLSVAFTVGGTDGRPIGYVDQAGVLAAGVAPTENARGDKLIEIRRFADEAAARAALEARQIQAYYVLPIDYLKTQDIKLYYWDKAPAVTIQRDFDFLVRSKLVANLPAEVQTRLRDGVELTARSADGQQEISGKSFINLLLPFFIGLFFMTTVMGSGGYMLQAVTDEKENRTVEVMSTSVAPLQFIGGKALGLIAVALTQIAILIVVIVAGVMIGARFIDVLQEVRVPWSLLLLIAVYFLPSFALISGMMIAVGAAVTELRQGQQIVGALNMLFTLPYFFVVVFFSAPNSTLSTILTLFPTTSFITVTMRWGLATIPAWELIVSWVLLVASSVAMMWAASRVFRAGMLRYGQRLDFRSMLLALRTRAQ
jgi:ABC-2 type transport system permease protein